MIDAFVNGLLLVVAWPTFGFLLLGVFIGFWVGILPGLGGPVALALMLPFTFDMPPEQAFAFLIGMASVTSTTGDLTAILFGVPGEVTSAALVVDGYPMSKNGEAGRALSAALMSSLVGAVVGAFALAIAIPIVRPLVLSITSPELFMLALLGITFVAALSSGALLKGLIAGGLGLMLGLVGMDPQSGTQRYTFGVLQLWDGVGLVAVALGLFAIPEIVDLAVKGTSIAEQRLGKISGVMEGIRDTFRHFFLTVRCSLIGTFTGLVPGIGAAAAQWLAYAHAYQSSRGKHRFGKGAIEGVLGPGAANNSKEGGQFIPMIAFGVPSGLTTAILLGALLIQGIAPGPAMLTTHLTLSMSFVWMMVLANVVAVSVLLLIIRHIAKITYVRGGLLIPAIILFVMIGAFAERNTFVDIVLMLLFGMLGVVMVRLGWPRPPVLLGLVLASVAETYLFISVSRYGVDWVTRPIVLAIMAAIVLVVFLPMLRRQRRGPPHPIEDEV